MLGFIAYLTLFLLPVDARAFSRADLLTGDVLLQSIPCYLCQMIEVEESSPYSHSGVVLREGNALSVLEAWNDVQKIPLSQYLALRKQNTFTQVLRPIVSNGKFLKLDSNELLKIYQEKFAGHHYDPAFLWNNHDAQGETFYCSEFTAKILNFVLPIPFEPKPMHFTHFRSDWIQYFQGNPPDGQPGISPGDFEKSPLLRVIGSL